jgi:putative ABC transport system permease protein
MNLVMSVRVALRAVSVNALRAILTALGVIIGVAAVVATVSIGTGAQQSVAAQVQALGTNLLTIFPGQAGQFGVTVGSQVQTLKYEDGLAIKADVGAVEDVAAEYGRAAQVVSGNQNTYTQVLGETPNFPEVRNWPAIAGTFLTDDDLKQRARVAVIGQTVAKTLFGDGDPIGQLIKINRTTFSVVGVMDAKGTNGFQDRDDVVFVPLTTAQKRLFGVEYVRTLYVKVRHSAEMDAAQRAIDALLRGRHHVPEGQDGDYTIRNQADILSTFQNVTKTITLMLGSVAAVSLIVGGIGIMNIMLVSVTERTREIGLRKAVGATRGNILAQFLVESVVLSALGGVIGILLGSGASRLVSTAFGWNTIVTPVSVAMAFGFAAAVGIFFGIYPARRAAGMDPIAALRYE